VGCFRRAEEQERLVEFVQPYYRGFGAFRDGARVPYLVRPDPQRTVAVDYRPWSPEPEPEERPFDFYGIAPWLDAPRPVDWYLDTRDQFVFDRAREGELISIERCESAEGPLPWDSQSGPRTEPARITIHKYGFTRKLAGGTSEWSLLLNLVQLRFIPLLKVSDDYFCYRGMRDKLRELGLLRALRGEDLGLDGCMAMVADAWESRWGEQERERAAEEARLLLELKEREENERKAPLPLYDANRLVADLPFTEEAIKILHSCGFTTLGELLRMSEPQLMATRRLGRRSLKNIGRYSPTMAYGCAAPERSVAHCLNAGPVHQQNRGLILCRMCGSRSTRRSASLKNASISESGGESSNFGTGTVFRPSLPSLPGSASCRAWRTRRARRSISRTAACWPCFPT
jgi:hypothetical protein